MCEHISKVLEWGFTDTHDFKAVMTNKKWEGELSAYREARAQGIQPVGTSMDKINEARRASDVMGKAFDANTMGDSKIIQNNTVSKLKEVGAI